MKRKFLFMLVFGSLLILKLSFDFIWSTGTGKTKPTISKFPTLSLRNPSPSPASWTLLITGDVLPARVVNANMVAQNDFMWPMRGISTVLQNADVTLINLESPLIANCPITHEGMIFCGDPRFAQALQESGVDIVNLANNHTLNHDWEGLAQTEKYLLEVGIETTGFTASSQPTAHSSQQFNNITIEQCNNDIFCSKFTILNVKDVRVGFLGYNAVSQSIERVLIQNQIEQSDALVDVLVVSVHWGKEYVRFPQADPAIAPEDPKELGRLFIDWGADVVVGNHPHWWQPIEIYQDKPIFYAMGNTVFDQEWSPETKEGFLAKLHFIGTDYIDEKIEIFPIGIKNYGEAYFLEGVVKERVIEEVDTRK